MADETSIMPFQDVMLQTRKALKDAGYDSAIIQALTAPAGVGSDLSDILDMDRVYQTIEPTLLNNADALEQHWKISQQQKEEGAELSPFEGTALRRLVGKYSELAEENKDPKVRGVAVKGIRSMADARKWWKDVHRAIGRNAADQVSQGVMNFTLGLSLLDGFSWVNKKTRLQFVPKDQRAELEARVLPNITLENDKEFSTGTSAGLWVLGQRMWGLGEKGLSYPITGHGYLLHNDTLKELGANLKANGNERKSQAIGQIPAIVTGLGPHLSWQEVVERNWDPVVDIDNIYSQLDDMGMYGDLIMGAMAGGDALAEIIADPMMIGGSIAAKVPTALRMGMGKLAVEKTAQIASEVARKTFKFEDALDAVATAEKALAKAETAGKVQAEAAKAVTGDSRMSVDMARKIIVARKRVLNEKKWADQFSDPGPNEVILTRTRQRDPEFVPAKEKAIAKYTEHKDAIEELHQERLNVMAREIDGGPKFELMTIPDQEKLALFQYRQLFGPDDVEQAGDALNVMARTGGVGVDDIALTPFAPEGARLQPTSQLSLIDWRKVEKANQLVREAHEARLPKLASQLEETSEYSKSTYRMLVTELDVARKNLGKLRNANKPILNAQTKKDAARVAKAKRTLKAIEKELSKEERKIIGEPGDNVFVRSERIKFPHKSKAHLAAEKELDTAKKIAEKNLQKLRAQNIAIVGPKGETRMVVDKARIKVAEDHLESLKRFAGQYVKKGMLKEATKYDDIWLPKSGPGITEDAGRFNRWLSIAGDRAMRSLYPGGLITSNFGSTKAGQIFAPMREPQRFYETYDPTAWDRIRSAYLRNHQETANWNDMMQRGMEKAGVLTKRKKFDPKKDFSPFKINKQKNKQLFDLLDTDPASPKWVDVAEGADAQMFKLHDQIRGELNHMASKQGLTDTPAYISGYIRHVFTSDQFGGGARPLEYIGLPAKAEVFASHLLARSGAKGYPRDAVLALDLYGRAANRKLIIEPMYDDIIQTGADLAKKHNNPLMQSYANDFVEQLRGKPQFWGAKIDEMLGGALNKDGKTRWNPGAIDRALTGLSGMMWAGTLAGNPRYPVMQIATGVATTAGRFGLFRTSKALFEMGTLEGQAVVKDIGVYKQFLDIFESPFMRKFSEFTAKRGYTVSPLGVVSTAQTEEFIRGTTALAAVDMYMTKLGISTWAEARQAGVANRVAFDALRAAEEVNHMFGALGRSPWGTRTLAPTKGFAVAGTQFLSFIPKQTEELLSQFNRDPGKIAQYLAMSGWMSRIAAEELGIDVTNYVGLGYFPEDPDEMTSPGVDAFMKNLDMLQAYTTKDPQKITETSTKFTESLNNLLPFFNAFSTASKASQRMLERQTTTATGDKLRELDFSKTLPQKLSRTGPGDVAESIRPEGGGQPGMGGDLLPTIFGQQNINDKLFRHGQEAIMQERKRLMFNLSNVVDEIIGAWDDGNLAKMEEAEAKLQNTFNIRLSSSAAIERAVEARSISWFLRELKGNPKLVDLFMKEAKKFGITVEP